MADVGLFLFVIGVFGLIWWLLSGLINALRAERARQEPSRRSNIFLLVAVALVIVAAAAWVTDNLATGFRIGMGGLAAMAIADAVRHRQKR